VLEHGHSTAETDHPNGTSEAGNGAKKPRRTSRTTRKAAAERIPEEVTVDFQAVKDQLKEASTAVRDAVTQAEGVRFEAAQVQTRLKERARETEAEAADALAKIRKARQEVEQGLEEARRCFEEARTLRRGVEKRGEEKAPEVPAPAAEAPVKPAAQTEVSEPVVAEAGQPIEEVARLESVAGEGEEVIKATIRSEPPRRRLIRHLNQAHSAESAVLSALQESSEKIIEPLLRTTLGEHRVLTHRHKLALEARLRALGAEPATNGKGVLDRMVGWMWESWNREPDDYDRTVQELLKATAAEHFEVSMYRALGALATAVGDEETAALAHQHQEEKAAAVAALDGYAPSLAGLAEQMVGVASAADPEHVVIEAEVKPETPAAPEKK